MYLIGANISDGTQTFKRRQSTNNGFDFGHTTDTKGHGKGNNSNKTFGNDSNRDRNGVDGNLIGVLELVNTKDNDDEDNSSKEDTVGHLVEALLERGLFVAVDVHEGGGDLTNLSLHSGAGDDTLGATLDNGGGGEGHVETVTERLVGVLDDDKVLLDREGFSGEESLVGFEVETFKETDVSSNNITVLKNHDVSGDGLVVGDGYSGFVADDLGGGRGHVAEGFHGLFGVEFLPESDGCVHDDDKENDTSFGDILGGKSKSLFGWLL